MNTQCCANCGGAQKIKNVIGTACAFARSMPLKPWRQWLDAPFETNPCDYFTALSPAEILRRQEIRASREQA
jgi:hypothetical protein